MHTHAGPKPLGTWQPGPNLLYPCLIHTATLLSSGQVLIVGCNSGYGRSSNAPVAQLYDPLTNSWSLTGPMNAARAGHAATLLHDGRVLVAGGMVGGIFSSSAELYQPATNTWSPAADMAGPCVDGTLTLLDNMEVLRVGGLSRQMLQGNNITNQVELYDSNSWQNISPSQYGRLRHTATLVQAPGEIFNGCVLVAGGTDGTLAPDGDYRVLSAVEYWRAFSGGWRSLADMTMPRMKHTATLLTNGSILVAGGWTGSYDVQTAEVFHQDIQTWVPTEWMQIPREMHAATLLQNGLVLVDSGVAGSTSSIPATGPANYVAESEYYNPDTNAWAFAGGVITARTMHTSTLLNDGRVLMAGGQDGNGNILASTELFTVTHP